LNAPRPGRFHARIAARDNRGGACPLIFNTIGHHFLVVFVLTFETV